MNRKKIILGSILGLFLVSFSFAKEKNDTKKETAEETMKKAMEAAGTPGPNHEVLKGMEGTWYHSTKFYSAPGAPAQESAGKAEFISVLDGRFIQERFEGTVMGKPFNGIGFYGYNNLRKKFVGSWMDDWSTTILMTEGTCNNNCKTIEMTGWNLEPTSEKPTKFRTVLKMLSDQEMTYSHYDHAKNGREYQSLEIHYTKQLPKN